MKRPLRTVRRTRVERPPRDRRALSALMRPLALPADAARGEPRVTIYADLRVFIENHSGIIEFDDEHVRIAARRLTLSVCGRELAMDLCEGRALLIAGRIGRIELERRGREA